MNKEIIPYINAENELAASVVHQAKEYSFAGADQLFIYNYSKNETEREEFLATLRQVSKEIDIPFFTGMYMARFEDGKKAFYTGADKIVLKTDCLPNDTVLDEVIARFGNDKVMLEVDFSKEEVTIPNDDVMLVAKHVTISDKFIEEMAERKEPIYVRDSLIRNDLSALLLLPFVKGVSTNYYQGKSIEKVKNVLREEGIEVNIFESSLSFDTFKLNENGLIPCVVQDYKTNEVLMLAYMNKESFELTCKTGKMTYYSRSREELWCKGDTSGHYQYVTELRLDCDKDTLLAKVRQVGSACHTGKYSCFFTELAKKETTECQTNEILTSVYDTIMDRKAHPKEGSYTNYLFDKGIDKILKKCGEEATEIVIAAKNPEAEELKYEIADFLYHLMVLMADCGLDWDDVMKELAHRK